ncbi:MAG: ubiquinone/menaquinone biosynthesis methyltransferase [Deltaproteobacteria bacterium]
MDSDRTEEEGTPLPDVAARQGHAGAHARGVRAMFDRIAPTYDSLNRALSFGIDARWRVRAVTALLDGLPPGPVLDLCAGTLDLSVVIAARAAGRHIVAVDLSPEMLARGAAKVRQLDLDVEARVGDATALELPDGHFAGVIAGFGIRNVSVTESAAREVKRVLAPGGRFVTLEFFRPERAVTRLFHATYATALLPAVGGLISRDRGAYRYLAASMKGFLSRGEYESLLARAGFERVRGEDLLLGIASVVCGERGAS